ncbi:M56 family metallopeptidase [Rhodanobacter sp. DHB23]|uniref:M56 family metallopeptidase n=1 Tax=Rhodanobacter sp. DHB23 TaxID=2775923 RepID=UPI00177CEC51|nr:M56 family metallopeptidase [Rhodanobacter sp. DHB23]MBD8871907.1 M56 family metallopeptidase [Rhodanobacter sp. DHB23]
MIAWMLYAVLVTLALSAAALLAERAAKVRGAVTRWLWIASLIGSLVLPMVIAYASIRLPDNLKSGEAPTSIVLRNATSIRMPSVLLDLEDVRPYAMSTSIDALARTIWAIASVLMALMLAVGSTLLQRRKRGWHEGVLCGERVLVAPSAGPAVVGLMRPRIVVPAWLLHASEEQQRCTLAHERSHLDARDPQVIALALALLTLMPWNPLLWWQFRRLRRAIEVDCDARVLLGGHDITAYCETLIQVGQRQSGRIAVVPAMSDSASFLELRIRQMLRKPGKGARASAAALVCASLGMAIFAAQVTPPDSGRRNAQATVVLGNDTLDRYTGFYQISPISLIAVTRAGNGLTVSISGQIAAPKPFHIVPIGETRFAVEGKDGASVHFVTDVHGYASRLVATQNGRVVLDRPRIDKATADRINAALAARIKAQKPFPGSEKALQLLLSDPDSGAGMSPDLAWVREQQKASREKYLAEIGPVESYTFTGVSKFGSDTYLVKRQHGEERILLVVDADGTLATAVRFSSMTPAPKS